MSADNTNNATPAGNTVGNAADSEVAAAMGFSRFAGRSTQYRGHRGRRWNGSRGRPGSLHRPEGPVSSNMLEASAAAPSTEVSSFSMPKPAAWTPDARERGRNAPASDSTNFEPGNDAKRNPRKNKTRKEKKDMQKGKAPASEIPGGLNDTTNRRPQRGDMSGARPPSMRRDVEDGATAPRGNQEGQKAINISDDTGVPAVAPKKDTSEPLAIAEEPLDAEEPKPKALPSPTDSDTTTAKADWKSDVNTPKDMKESPKKEAENPSKSEAPKDWEKKPEEAISLNKWSPIFPTGGPRPIPKPLDDGTSNEMPKRTNYIDKQGNYHAPNGTIMSRELLNMFASGKIRNALGDRAYFMPSFLDDSPPKGQLPVVLAPTPYRIFYDPGELKKAQ